MNKSRKGITLIALVITIIVLLILAAVSIAMLSGDNSILKRAKSSVGYNYIGAAKDEVSLAYNSAYAKYLTNRYTEAKTGVDEKNIAKSNEYELTPVSEVKIAYKNNQEPSYIKIAAVTAEDKNLAILFAKELKTHVASNGAKTHECTLEYNETEVSTVKLTYTDDQGTSYFVTGTLNTTVGSESFSWGGISTGTDVGGGSGGAGGGTEVSDLKKLQNYFTPGNGTIRTLSDVMPNNDGIFQPVTDPNISEEEMPNVNLINIVNGGQDFVSIEYNNSFYKVTINQNMEFTNVEALNDETKLELYFSNVHTYTVNQDRFYSLYNINTNTFEEDEYHLIDANTIEYLGEGEQSCYYIQYNDRRYKLIYSSHILEKIEEIEIKDVTYAQIENDIIEVGVSEYNLTNPGSAIKVFRYITNLYEIETINNISITNTNIVNYGDTLGNLIPVNYGETTITLHGASGKTKQITIKVIEEEERN